MSNKELYKHSYRTKRKALIDVWNARNFFGANRDMFGFLMTNENFISAHHVYDDDKEFIALAVLSRYVHDYLDSYLKVCDKKEYILWNNYLLDVCRYLSKNRNPLIEKELILKRDILLNKMYYNVQNNIYQKSKLIETYLIDVIRQTSSDVPFSYKDTLNKVDTYNHKHPYLDILDKPLNKKVEYKLDSKETLNNYYEKKYNVTWMGSYVDSSNIIDEEYNLSDIDLEILTYLRSIPMYDKWNRVFYGYKCSDIDNSIVSKYARLLRYTTFHLVGKELDKKENANIKGKIEQKMYELSFNKRTEMYGTNKYTEQMYMEFIRIKNKDNGEKVLIDKENDLSDMMGISYANVGPDNKNYYLSTFSQDMLEILKYRNKDLYIKWQTFFSKYGSKKEKKEENPEFKQFFLDSFHKILTLLRNETRVYFQDLLDQCNLEKKKIKYGIFVSELSKESFKIHVKRIGDTYDSSNYDKNIYLDYMTHYSNDTSSCVPTEFDLLRSDSLHYIFLNSLNDDWFGLKYQKLDEDSLDVYETLGVESFLYDGSLKLLLVLKEIDINLYNEWIELFNKINSSDRSYYENDITALMGKTANALDKYKFDKTQRLDYLKLRRTYTRRINN